MSHWCYFDMPGPNCTAQPMYVLKPTCSYYGKWCGSDDDAHTNTGQGEPVTILMRHSTTCFDHAIPVGQLPWTKHNHATFFSVCNCPQCVKNVLGTAFGAIFLFLFPAVASRALADFKTRSAGSARPLTPLILRVLRRWRSAHFRDMCGRELLPVGPFPPPP